MATGGKHVLYQEDDMVDEYLLNQLSKYILFNHLGALARDLGFSQAEFSRIATPTNQPKEQIFKVHVKGESSRCYFKFQKSLFSSSLTSYYFLELHVLSMVPQ